MTLSQSGVGPIRTQRRPIEHLDITVLAGGPGGEREVSLQSGAAVAEALQRLGHQVTVSDIGPGDFSALDRRADFVFVALHGEFGEGGIVQAELELRGLPYCGSGPAASRIAMNKVETKRAALQHGVPTPAFAVCGAGETNEHPKEIGLPAMVKPVASGSSVDTTLARTPEQLAAAIKSVAGKYGEALVERHITGREFTVGILGDRVLPVCEIRTKREFYNYQAKYVDDDTQYLFDVDISEEELAQLQALSLRAHRAIGCEVFSRVDWMVDGVTHDPYLLEINTIPGFTSHSLLPKAAAQVGIPFDRLCSVIIELSLEVRRGAK